MMFQSTIRRVIFMISVIHTVDNCYNYKSIMAFTASPLPLKNSKQQVIITTTTSTSTSTSTTPTTNNNRVKTMSLYYEGGSDYCSGGGDNDKIEKARKRLEALISSPSNDNNNIDNSSSSSSKNSFTNNKQQQKTSIKQLIKQISNNPHTTSNKDSQEYINQILPPTPPLTSGEREKRLLELKLLEQLASSDDVVDDLLYMWSSEKGKDAQQRLQHIDDFLNKEQLIAAEQMLIKLLQDYDDDSDNDENNDKCGSGGGGGIIYWVEPIHRLAKLRFKQGRYQDAYQLCLFVLHLKPWHFYTINVIVEICLQQGNRDMARSWAEKRLPKLVASTSFPPFASNGPANPQRARWVHQAIQQAQEALSHLQYQTQCEFLGNPEEYYTQNSNDNVDKDKDGTAENLEQGKAADTNTKMKEFLERNDKNVIDFSTQQILMEDDHDDTTSSSWQ